MSLTITLSIVRRYWVEDETQVPLNATILLSKNAGRYRVQSNYLPALWFVGNELCKRLKKYFEATGGSDFDMWCAPSGCLRPPIPRH
jgi:hypothetical protein